MSEKTKTSSGNEWGVVAPYTEEEMKNTKINLSTADGSQTFGTVSLGAAEAIQHDRVDSYTPIDENEKKVIEAYKGYRKQKIIEANPVLQKYGIDPDNFTNEDYLKWLDENNMEPADAKKTGNLYRSKTSGGFLGFGSKALATDEQMKDAEAVYQFVSDKSKLSWLDPADWADLAKAGATQGVATFNKWLSATADSFLPTEILGKYDFVSKWNESNTKTLESATKVLHAATRGSDSGQVVGDTVSAVVTALPNTVLAIMTGGTSAVASTAGVTAAGAANTAALSTGVASAAATAKTIATSMAKNPQYWFSFAQTVGIDYEDAKANGASDTEAAYTAIFSSLINAGVEIGGGVEQLPKELKKGGTKKILSFVKSTLEEGNEEVMQGMVSRATSKLIYDSERELYSTTNDKAVINPATSAKELGMGMAVGGILGGAQMGTMAILNKVFGGNAPTDSTGVKVIGDNNPTVKTDTTSSAGATTTVAPANAVKFAPENASDDVKGIEDKLIAKGVDEVTRQKVVTAAMSIEQALVGKDKTVRDVFNNVSKVTTNAATEIRNKAGATNAYWTLFGENVSAIPQNSDVARTNLVNTYSGVFTEALKDNNPEKYNAVLIAEDGTDLSSAIAVTILTNNIPANVRDAGAYRLVASEVKGIVDSAEAQIRNERAEIYGAENSSVSEATEVAPVVASVNETEVYTAITSGNVTSKQADAIISTPESKAAFEQLTGVKLTGTKSEQRNTVRNWVSDPVNIESLKAKNVTGINSENMHVSTENTTENGTVSNTDVDNDKDAAETYRADADGKTRFKQMDIDYKKKTMRKGQFRVRGEGTSSFTVDGHIRGKYGIYKKAGAKDYTVTLLNSGLDVGKFKTLTEAKKAATFFDDNLATIDLTYRPTADGNYVLEPTPELKGYMDALKMALDNKTYEGYNGAEATEIKDGTAEAKESVKAETSSEETPVTEVTEETVETEPSKEVAVDNTVDNTVSEESSEERYSLSSMGATFFEDENITVDEFREMLEDGSYKDYQGYKDYVENVTNIYKQSRGLDTLSEEDVAEIERQIEGIINIGIAAAKAGYNIFDSGEARSITDSKKRLLFSSLEPNSDYITSSDISAICDKRKNFAEIYDDIVKMEESRGVPVDERFFSNVDNYFILHKLMADKGLTVPCEECYVESMRKNLAPMANAFIRLVTESDSNNKANDQLYHQDGKDKGKIKKNNSELRNKVRNLCTSADAVVKLEDITVEMLTTADGLAQLKLQEPLLYEAFNSFYGQSKPKMPRAATPFRPGELIALLTDNKGEIKTGLINKIKSTGGFRLQSYSDFQIENFTDVIQTIFEASMLGLNGHAYTKVPAFLEATKGTNLKRNISIFMYEDDGKWMLDKKNSFPMELEDTYALVASDDSGNTSIIAVSQNADMSAWIMANDLVGFGIPFHKSGLKMDVVRARTVKTPDGREVLGYANQKDHTAQQSEVYKRTLSDKKKENTKVSKPINIYSFWDFEDKANQHKYEALKNALSEGKITEDTYREKVGMLQKNLIKKNLTEYIKRCEANNYRPKFREYLMNNEAVLNNVLRYAKELGFVPQDATVDDISFKYGEYTVPYGYYKFLGDFGMFKPDGTVSPIETLSLENYDFDAAVDFFKDAEKLRTNELLQQFENGKVRETYRKMIEDGELTTEQLQGILKEKCSEIVRKVVDGEDEGARYSVADDDDGYSRAFDMQQEIAQLSRDIAVIEESEDYGKAMDAFLEAAKNGDTNQAVSEYEKRLTELGLTEKKERMKVLQDELTELQNSLRESREQEALAAEQKAIEESGLSEADYFRKQAVKIFGYTPHFVDAGYITPNGKMLNFSGEKGMHFGMRGQDHRAIETIYANVSRTAAMHKFMSGGNIRIMAESPGLDISSDTPPTAEQYATIRKFVREYAKERRFFVDITGSDGFSVGDYFYEGAVNADRVVNDIKYFFENGTTREQSSVSQFRYSVADDDYAPAFYSHMANVIDGMKQDKIGAASVVSYLKGRGVKDEEIKWSGIEAFLDGKKSVTKAELQEFAAGSMLQIEEKTLSSNPTLSYTEDESRSLDEISTVEQELWDEIDDIWWNKYESEMPWDIRFADDSVNALRRELNKRQRAESDDERVSEIYSHLNRIETLERNRDTIVNRARKRAFEEDRTETRYDKYTLGGGSKYRELLFMLPNSEYSNAAMQTHWGEEGVLAHARVQDFEVDGKKMLFIEEIQSDWHNQGHKKGYREKGQKTEREIRLADEQAYDDFINNHVIQRISNKMREVGYDNSPTIVANLWEGNLTSTYAFLERIGVSLTNDEKGYIEEEVYRSAERHKELKDAADDYSAPDAPFRNNYHEYVLKSLLRMAAEQGYDSIGWTPADIQSKRWSDEFAEGYRIEYDQDIPKFLNKYGKKWGAKVGETNLNAEGQNDVTYEIVQEEDVRGDGQTYSTEDEAVAALVNETNRLWGTEFSADEVHIYPGDDSIAVADNDTGEIIGEINIIDNGTKVWSMDITEAMKDSVLYEGQALYSLEKEGKNNEQTGRSNTLSGNSRRGYNGGSRKQAGRISRFERRNKGRDAAERKSFAEELIRRGQTEEVTEGHYRYTRVKPEAYNDDMAAMVAEAASKGVELGFFVGNAKVNFDSKKKFVVDGIKFSSKRVLVQYDAVHSPQKLAKHEICHTKFLTPAMKAIKGKILGSLTESEKREILSRPRYKRYARIYKGRMNQVWEEFVADTISGMNDYTEKYIDLVTDYWYGNAGIDSYSPAEYTNSIDAGGSKVEVTRFIEAEEIDPEDVDLDSATEQLDFDLQIRKIRMKVFPPYDESGGSDSHERAERWARDDEVDVGAQKLASHNDRWYVIEKFEDLEYGYQIIGAVRAKTVVKFMKEVKEYANEIDRNRDDISDEAISGVDARRETGLRGHSDGGDTNQHLGKTGGSEGLALDKTGGEILPSDGKRIAEQDSEDRQDVKLSLADDGIPDLFDAWEEATRETTPKKSNSDVKSSKPKAMAAPATHAENEWVDGDATTKSDPDDIPTLSELIKDIGDAFGVTIKSGKVMVRDASGIYKTTPEVIRTRKSNKLPTIIHELGHHLNKKYNIEKSQHIKEAEPLLNIDVSKYSAADLPGEMAAEFVRRYFKNPEAIARKCPNLTKDFLEALDKKDAKSVSIIAPRVNAYLSAEAVDRYGSTIIDSKSARRLDKEDLSDQAHELYTKWFSQFHPIKQLVDFVEESTGKVAVGIKNAYKLATNSLNAHNITNFVLLEKFRDLNGNILSGKESFVECVKGVDLTNRKTQKAFSEYLKLKHALEVQAKGKDVFADEVLGDPKTISAKIAKLEQIFPEFKDAAKKLYEFQHNVLTEYAVKSGLMTQEQADFLHNEYPCYVPFYRYVKGRKGSFARRSLANQKSPIMKMKGSGLDTLDPLENIVKNTERIISASIKHQTVDIIGQYADTVDGVGAFIERIPPDQVAKTVDVTALKEEFTDRLQNIIRTSNDYFAVSDLLDDVFGDEVTGFNPVVNESKGIIMVQRGDERAYYQVHNRALLESITELSPKQASGLLNLLATSMGKINALITQFNPMFSISNPIRDIMTAYDLGDIDNPAKFIKDYTKALMWILSNNDMYTQFKAMGGGHASRLNADLGEISKSVKDLQMSDAGLARRAIYAMTHHPIQLLTAFADFTESIPRFMTFMNAYDKTGDLQEAMYQADDITTNFKRRGSGATAKVINSTFRFNNAALQGLDKTRRTFSDADGKRKIQITAKWLTVAILGALLRNFWNREKDEEGYENLSSYKKNNFYNFAIGDGQFISLPKERENAVIDTLVERTIDALCGEDDAFYDFGGYLASQLLPPMIPGTVNPIDAVHDLANSTLLGPLTDIGFNKDFKGSPIESDYEKDKVSSERYGDGTSKLAYELGQTKLAVNADLSPKKIDHMLSAFGFLASANTALFPMNESRRDVTVGLRNKFITDSNYSTDVINKLYDNRDLAKRDFNYELSTGEATIDKAVEYERTSVVTDYVSGMNKAIKALPEDEQRNGRIYLVRALNNWDYSNTASQQDMSSKLYGETLMSDDCIITDVPEPVLSWTENKKDAYGRNIKDASGKIVKLKYTYQMTPQEYHEYVTNYLTLVDRYRLYVGGQAADSNSYLSALSSTKTEVKKELNKVYQARYKSAAQVIE